MTGDRTPEDVAADQAATDAAAAVAELLVRRQPVRLTAAQRRMTARAEAIARQLQRGADRQEGRRR
jgi:hypothetical protein